MHCNTARAKEGDGLKAREALDDDAVREIAPEPHRLYAALKRVRVEQAEGELSDDAIAQLHVSERQALVIVNSRRHARELFRKILRDRQEGALHLSTAMCAAHRRDVLHEVRARLTPERDEPVRLIATSLVEAGVDIDFPFVMRAVAGARDHRGDPLEAGIVDVVEHEAQVAVAAGVLRRGFKDR